MNPFEVLPGEVTAIGDSSRVRYQVLAALCLLSGILYLDRICISTAVPIIQRELELTNTQVSYVLMAFTLAYGLFEVPTGRWGDKYGARRVLTRISLWWSAFTALTGACTGLGSLIAVRFLFGAGEAGAFPNAARVLSKWFPDDERGRAQGIFLAASQLGGALAPALSAVLIGAIGWRWTFVVFGSTGVVWAAGFWWWYRDEPSQHSAVSPKELELIGERVTAGVVHESVPWKFVLTNPSVLLLSTIMICASFNSYIYFSWYPKSLQSGRGVDAQQAGFMASIVLLCSALGTLLGGFLLDTLRINDSSLRRKLLGGSAFLFAASMLFAALRTDDPWLATTFTALSCFATQVTQPLWWSCTISVSGRHVGALFGLMNSCGVAGAMASQFLVGRLADWLGSRGLEGRAQWDPVFYVNLGVLVTAAVLWFAFVDRPIEPADTAAPPAPF